jgi:7-carboxy-7-deazaguanine synthase
VQLVAFQEAVFSTVQGEGLLVGTPSTFVRLWGCDSNCSWCDTKESWRPGSKSVQCDVASVAERVLTSKNKHVVITGGNPLLQGEELAGLVQRLKERGCHVTLETQGTVYHRVVHAVNLLSLSPKLHDWRTDTLKHFFNVPGVVQFKIVVQTESDVIAALARLSWLRAYVRSRDYRNEDIHSFIQPEWSIGRKWVGEIVRILKERQAKGDEVDSVRVLPQVHRLVNLI